MSTVIKIKRSTTGNQVPTNGSLALGELAVNITDKKIYIGTGGEAAAPVLISDYNSSGLTQEQVEDIIAASLVGGVGIDISYGDTNGDITISLDTITSAQLASLVTDETGSGALVFGTTPTFTTSVIGGATMAVFNTVSTTVNGFGAATTMTLGATTGTAYVRNPTLTLGNTTSTITTKSGSANTLSLSPYGSVTLAPLNSTFSEGGDQVSLQLTNTVDGLGTANITGGDLYLGNKKTTEVGTPTAVNIVFEGATDNGFETTLTVTDPTADRTITLPDATGTVALTANKLSAFAATTSSELLGVISDETGTGSLVFATSPTLVTPALGTPSALVGTNITGTASGLTAGTATTAGTVTTAAQPSITSVGTLTAINTSGVITGTNTTASTSSTTGAVITAGGLGVAGAAFIGDGATVLGANGLTIKDDITDTRFLNIYNEESAATYIVKRGTANRTLNILHENSGPIYIGDSDGANNGAYIGVEDSNSIITINAETVEIPLGAISALYSKAILATTETGQGFIPSVQIIIPSTDFTLVNDMSLQDIFASSQNLVTLQANTTYMFESMIIEQNSAATATSHYTFLALTLDGGATASSFIVSSMGFNTTVFGAAVTAQNTVCTDDPSNSGWVATTTTNAAFRCIKFEGTIRVTDGGTMTPQLLFSAAPGNTTQIKVGSYFKIYAIGSDTIQTIGAIS